MLMPFIALPYIIKTVGTDNYGKIVFAQALASYFFIFVNFGLDLLAVKKVSQNRNNIKVLRLVCGTVILIKMCLCIAGLVIFSGLLFSMPRLHNDLLLYYCAYTVCLADVVFIPWLFQGLEKMHIITIIRASSVLLYVILLWCFIRHDYQYPLIPLLQSGCLLLTAVAGLFYAAWKEKIKPVFPYFRFAKKFVKESFPFFLSRSSVIFNNTIATIVIGATIGTQQVAIYDIAQRIARAALIPVSMVTQAVYPHNAKYRNKKFALQIFLILIILSLIGLGILYWLAPFLVDFLSSGKLLEAIPLLRFFEIYIFLGVLTAYLGTPLLIAWGYFKPFNNSVFASTAILVILYWLFGVYDIKSIYLFAGALTVSELVIMLYRGYYCQKYNLLKY